MKKASEKLFEKYLYLADIYAGKLNNAHLIGFTKDDVAQELRIKLFNAVKSYGKRWYEYRQTGKYKPVSLETFLRTTMNNRLIDFMNMIQTEASNHYHAPIQTVGEVSVEIGYNCDFDTTMDFSEHAYIIAGVDLLADLEPRKALCFSMFLKGVPINGKKKEVTLHKMFDRWFDPEQLVEQQLTKLRNNQELKAEFGKSNSFVVQYQTR